MVWYLPLLLYVSLMSATARITMSNDTENKQYYREKLKYVIVCTYCIHAFVPVCVNIWWPGLYHPPTHFFMLPLHQTILKITCAILFTWHLCVRVFSVF